MRLGVVKGVGATTFRFTLDRAATVTITIRGKTSVPKVLRFKVVR